MKSYGDYDPTKTDEYTQVCKAVNLLTGLPCAQSLLEGKEEWLRATIPLPMTIPTIIHTKKSPKAELRSDSWYVVTHMDWDKKTCNLFFPAGKTEKQQSVLDVSFTSLVADTYAVFKSVSGALDWNVNKQIRNKVVAPEA